MVLKRITNMWRKLAGGGGKKLPQDVPPGHVVVMVEEAGKRFIVRADYLNHPIFKQLLDQAHEEYTHSKNGPLAIPCAEFLLQDIIHSLRGDAVVSQLSCLWKDSTLARQGFTEGLC